MCHMVQPYNTYRQDVSQLVCAHVFHGVPVEDVVVGKALAVKQISDELSQVGVVRLFLEAEGATVVEVCSKLVYEKIILLQTVTKHCVSLTTMKIFCQQDSFEKASCTMTFHFEIPLTRLSLA